MNPTMNTTTVPEPSTVALLLFAGWLIASIILLSKPRLRVAGIVVLAAPLALAMIAIPFWWLAAKVPQSGPAWQQHRVTRNRIELDVDSGSRGKVVVRPTPVPERDHVVVASDYAAAVPAETMTKSIVFLLLAVLFFGGLAAAVMMLAFPKTRPAGIVLLAAGAVVIVVGFFGGVFIYRGQMQVARSPVHIHTNHGETKIDSSIPVESGERPEVKPVKPAAKPPAGKVEPTGRAAMKTPTVAEKKPAATKNVAEKKPAAEASAASPAPAKKPPDWVSQPSQMLGDTYQTTIVVGPFTTWQECEDDLPAELQKALNRYVETCLGQPAGAHPVRLPYEFFRDQVVKGKWEEIGPSSVGPMARLYVLLQFDRKVKDRILDEYRRNVVVGRLWITGGGLAGVLWLLAVMYGYLRFDLKTGGLYRRRLRFAAVLAILGPVAAALLVVA
jgi:hypothetical protein